MLDIQMIQIASIKKLLAIAYELKALSYSEGIKAGINTDEEDQNIDKIIKGLKSDMQIIKDRPISFDPITSNSSTQKD